MQPSMLEHIDNYCERTGTGFSSEPLNAITNAAFLIAAWYLCRHYRNRNLKDFEALTLMCLVAVVGIGSFLFHTYAMRWSLYADVIPITLFIFFYLWVCLRRLAGFSSLQTALFLGAFFGISTLAENVPQEHSFNGSISYFPSLGAIILIATLLKRKQHPLASRYFIAFACFGASLTFRSLDMSLCETIPTGTHFLWHMLNGLLLFILTKAIIDTPKKPAK